MVVRLAGVGDVNDLLGRSPWRRHLDQAAAAVRAVVGGDAVVRPSDVHDVIALLPGDVRPPLEVASAVAQRVRAVWPRVHVGAHRAWSGEDEVLRAATLAMVSAQASGALTSGYDEAAHRRAVDLHGLEQDLHGAVARGELLLHYQPVLDLAGRGILGCEALVRWQHPTRGLLPPVSFIPLAESSGAIHEIGRWVLAQACADAARWQRDTPGGADISVAVNVSRAQLVAGQLLTDVREALTAAALPPAALNVEITESALVHDAFAAVDVLHDLRRMGVRISLDDFGTGASSLSQLRALPVDVLKIDKAFVDGVARADEAWAVAVAIVQLACSLDKGTVAEGVETASQLAHLRALGCEQFQGFLEAEPLPLSAFQTYISVNSSR